MSKYNVLGIVNVLLAFLFAYFFLFSTGALYSITSLPQILISEPVLAVLLISPLTNIVLAYGLFTKKENRLPFFLYLFVTALSVFWWLLFFIVSLFASNVAVHLVFLTLIITIYYFLHKSSIKIALLLSFVTLLVMVVAAASGFEEDYCWGKGVEADGSGVAMIIATKEDVELLNVEEGAQIGVSFRAHVLCHSTFSFIDALKEKYFLIK